MEKLRYAAFILFIAEISKITKIAQGALDSVLGYVRYFMVLFQPLYLV